MPKKAAKKQHVSSFRTKAEQELAKHHEYKKLEEEKNEDEEEVIVSEEENMSNLERELSAEDVGGIALRLSVENAARTDKPIWELVGPSYVTKVEDDFVFVFSSARWAEVKRGLETAKVPYHYQRAVGFSKPMPDDPAAWKTSGPVHTKIVERDEDRKPEPQPLDRGEAQHLPQKRELPPVFRVRIDLSSEDGLKAVRAIRSRLPDSTVVGLADQTFLFDLEQMRALRDAGVRLYPPAERTGEPFKEPLNLDGLLGQ